MALHNLSTRLVAVVVAVVVVVAAGGGGLGGLAATWAWKKSLSFP